jgi:hypothetical protein
MHLESLESRTFLSGAGNTVSVPLHGSAVGSLPGNLIVGNAAHLGRFTASFNTQGVLILTAANGDELWAAGTLVPTPDPVVLHVDGTYVGGTGRFTGASGGFSHDLVFAGDQGNFTSSFEATITLQRPWNGRA